MRKLSIVEKAAAWDGLKLALIETQENHNENTSAKVLYETIIECEEMIIKKSDNNA